MERVLFVDDEINVLNGIRRSLHDMRDEWEMLFANDARQALALMDDTPADVIVTDIRMPGMGGDELIQYVRRKFPRTVPIALSGQCEAAQALAIRKSGVRYISKPCIGAKLATSIAEALTVRANFHGGDISGDELRRALEIMTNEMIKAGFLTAADISTLFNIPSHADADLRCLESAIKEAGLDFDDDDVAALLAGSRK